MSEPLPLDRPLWELLLIPGASAEGLGVVLRIHHSIADGMSAVTLVQQLFDRSEESAPNAAAAGPAAHSGSGRRRRSILARFGSSLHRVRLTLSGREVASTMLLGERSAHRGVAFLRADLADLEAHARSQGATVNDMLLAAAASGYRAALRAAGEAVPERLPVSVPVALPRRGIGGNHVGVMLVRLPLGEPDPDERLRLIAAQTRTEKVTARQQGTLELMRGPIGARIMDRVVRRQHVVAGFVTNVPGPTRPLSLAGASVEAIWPVAVLAANVRLGVAAVSYDGAFSCGIHFDADSVPGADFSRGMGEELSRLAARPRLRSAMTETSSRPA
jgi:WS/DGAT/MGAT family acyltransferase